MRPSLAIIAALSVAASLSAQAQFKIEGYDTPSYIQFADQHVEVQGNETNAVITVMRSGDFRKFATVDFETQDGTAEGNVHFRPCGGTINFAAGQSVRTISIPILHDQPAPPKIFQVELKQTTADALVVTPSVEVEIKSQPTLALQINASGLVLSWIDVGSVFQLESKSDVDWQTVPAQPSQVNGEFQVQIPSGAQFELFRLRLADQ